MKQLLLSLALTAFASLSAAAAEPGYADIAAPVPGASGVTYFKLMQQVIPGLTQDGDTATGQLPKGIGHLTGDDAVGETPETVTIRSVQAVPVRAEGRSMLWLLADLGSGGNLGTYTLLAVFDDAAKPKLLDAVEVDTDQLTFFVSTPLPISTEDEAMLIGSEHSNSSQTYQNRMLAHLHDGKLKLVASIYTFGTRDCDLIQTEELSVTADADSADHGTIEATITRNRALVLDDECDDPPDDHYQHRQFSATYVWDSVEQHYAAARDDFEDLARQDEALF